MAQRTVRIGGMTFRRSGVPSDVELWGFALNSETVEVHPDDVERFDRLNGSADVVVVAAAPVVPSGEPEPPRVGKGSGLDAWVAYAENQGLLVPENASRDDVIALVDDSK